MVFSTDTERASRIRDQQEGIGNARKLAERIRSLELAVDDIKITAQNETPVEQVEPLIGQLWRNSDNCFSVDGWHNSTHGTDQEQQEDGLFFTHPADPQITLYDGVIDAPNTAFFSERASFEISDAGKIIIIDGAGESGAPLVTTIRSIDDVNNIVLTDSSSTPVTGARFRYGCLKLGKLSAKTSVAAVTNSIKAETHPAFSSNIKSPKWDIPSGTIHWGGNTNRITHFLASVDSFGNFYPQLQPLQAGRDLYVQFKFALKNKFIKPKGLIYAALFNNTDVALEPLVSSDFRITAVVDGTPAGTATTQYFIVSYTDLGAKFVSRVVSVPSAPDANSYNPPEVQVRLAWDYIPGIIRMEVYRKIGAGNVFLLEAVNSNLSGYTDVNNAARTDTGITIFPVIPFALSHSRCYAETDDFVGIIGVEQGSWSTMKLQIPMSATTSMAGVTELAVTIGVTEPAAYEVPVSTEAGVSVVSSSEPVFVGGMNSCAAIVRDTTNDNNVLNTSVAAVTGPTLLTMAAPVPWDSQVVDGVSTTVIEIAYADPYAYLSDCFGISINRGKWTSHPEDSNRMLPVTSQPTGSTQEPPGHGGGGGPDCMHEDGVYDTIDGPMIGASLKKGIHVWYGTENRYNRIKHVKRALLHDYLRVTAKDQGVQTFVSNTHRMIAGLDNRKFGTAMPDVRKDEKVLLVIDKKCILDAIEVEDTHDPDGKWFISIEFDADPGRPEECHLGVCDKFMFHNRKVLPE